MCLTHKDIAIFRKNIKNLILKVKSNGDIVMSVPTKTPNHEIDKFLQKQSRWIEKRLALLKSNQMPKINTDEILYLGKIYNIKNINKNNLHAEEWYRQKATYYFNKLIKKYSKLIDVDVKKVRIKQMKTRWGSCNSHKRYINLNLELIKKPPYAIKYVILHELAHIIHPNHSKDFYDFIQLYMPDYKQRKKYLRGI